MAQTKILNLDTLRTQAASTYEFKPPTWDAVKLRDLKHGEVKALNTKYPTDGNNQIIDFSGFIDEAVCLASVEPTFTPEILDEIVDAGGNINAIGVHVGRRCNILAQPKDEAPDPKSETAVSPPSTSS